MKDHHPFSIALIFLVFTSSFNLEVKAAENKLRTYLLHSGLVRQLSGGEKINDWIRKFNERRAAGILAQPRVGRTIGIGSFGRSDGGAIGAAAAAGLVHYPRVGRSGASDDNQKYQLESNEEMRNSQDLLETPVILGQHENNLEEKLRKRLNDNGIWTSMPTSRIIKEQHRYPHYDEEIDDSPKMEGQLLLYHLPREMGNRIR